MQECVEALQSFRDRESLLSFTSTRGVVGGGGDIADRAAPALAAEGEEEQGGLSAAEGLLPLQQLLLREYSGTRPNISESHSEISTRVPFCIGRPGAMARRLGGASRARGGVPAQVSTRILGRRAAPFSAFRTPYRVPRGVLPKILVLTPQDPRTRQRLAFPGGRAWAAMGGGPAAACEQGALRRRDAADGVCGPALVLLIGS